jgi:hypothetical protein
MKQITKEQKAKEDRIIVNDHRCIDETERLLTELGVVINQWKFGGGTTVYGSVPSWDVKSFSLSQFVQRNLWSGLETDLIPENYELGLISSNFVKEDGRTYSVRKNLFYDKASNSFYSKQHLSNSYGMGGSLSEERRRFG